MRQFLHKYRCWDDDNHKKMLREREIFFTSPANFNDPFDCGLPIKFFDMSDKVAEQKIRSHIERSGKRLSSMEKAFAVDDGLRQFQKMGKDESARKKNRKDVLKRFEEWFAIFSVSEIRDNILMWSHYSDKHKGFCVGFDQVKLVKAIARWCSDRVGYSFLPVTYQRNYPDLVPDANPDNIEVLEKALTTKAEQWKYEKEHRIILNKGTNIQVKLPKGVIREVVIGAEATDTTRGEIAEVVKSSDSGIKLYQAGLSENEYSLTIDEIK